jgi:hypothetical protein
MFVSVLGVTFSKDINSLIPGLLPRLRFIRGPLVSVLAYTSVQSFHLWSGHTSRTSIYRIRLICGLVIGVLLRVQSRVNHSSL